MLTVRSIRLRVRYRSERTNSPRPAAIGGRADNVNGNINGSFFGAIDEMSIYNRALSTAEIQTIFSAGGAGKCAQECVAPPAGLVSWWTGNGNANDAVGGNNGTLVGGVTFAQGEVGQAFDFDGSSGYVSVPNNPQWDFGSNPFTIEFWANFNSVPGSAQSFIACDNGPFAQNKWIFFYGYGVSGLTFEYGPSDGRIGNFPFTPNPGQWYHIALTRSGTAFTFYVNGSPIGTDTETVVLPSMTAPLTIGNAEGQFYFNGDLDEVSIYSTALSAGQIAAIYNAGSAGKCLSGCVAPPSGWSVRGRATTARRMWLAPITAL